MIIFNLAVFTILILSSVVVLYMLGERACCIYAQENNGKPSVQDSSTAANLGPINWTNKDKDTLSISTVTNESTSGNGGLRVDIKPATALAGINKSSWSRVSTDFIPIIENGYYNYSLDVSAKDVNGLHPKVYHYDSNKTEINSNQIFGKNGTFEGTFTKVLLPPKDTKFVKLQILVKPTPGKNTSYLLHNVQILKQVPNLTSSNINPGDTSSSNFNTNTNTTSSNINPGDTSSSNFNTNTNTTSSNINPGDTSSSNFNTNTNIKPENYDDLNDLVLDIKNRVVVDKDISLNAFQDSGAYKGADKETQDCIDLAGKIGDNLTDREIVHCSEDPNHFKTK